MRPVHLSQTRSAQPNDFFYRSVPVGVSYRQRNIKKHGIFCRAVMKLRQTKMDIRVSYRVFKLGIKKPKNVVLVASAAQVASVAQGDSALLARIQKQGRAYV